MSSWRGMLKAEIVNTFPAGGKRGEARSSRIWDRPAASVAGDRRGFVRARRENAVFARVHSDQRVATHLPSEFVTGVTSRFPAYASELRLALARRDHDRLWSATSVRLGTARPQPRVDGRSSGSVRIDIWRWDNRAGVAARGQ